MKNKSEYVMCKIGMPENGVSELVSNRITKQYKVESLVLDFPKMVKKLRKSEYTTLPKSFRFNEEAKADISKKAFEEASEYVFTVYSDPNDKSSDHLFLMSMLDDMFGSSLLTFKSAEFVAA